MAVLERERTDMASLKLRLREPLRAQIEAAALDRGVSMNAEMIARLEDSFRGENAMGMALDLAFGPQLAAIGMLLMRLVQRASDGAETAAGRVPGTRDWLVDPYAHAQVKLAIDRVLDVLHPDGDVVVPPFPREAAVWGERVANVLLAAAAGEVEAPDPLKTWGDKIYARLGQTLAAGITRRLDEDLPQHERVDYGNADG